MQSWTQKCFPGATGTNVCSTEETKKNNKKFLSLAAVKKN